jgi:hypothetical protein
MGYELLRKLGFWGSKKRFEHRLTARNSDSVMKRFKTKIAKDCMSLAGIAVTYSLLSGEAEDDAWDRWKTTFALRVPGGFKYELAYKYLKDKPKWLL